MNSTEARNSGAEIRQNCQWIEAGAEKIKTQLAKAKKSNDTLKSKLNHTEIKLIDQMYIEETNKLDEKYDVLE